VEERLRLDYSVDGGTLHLPPSQDLIAADRRRPNSDHLDDAPIWCKPGGDVLHYKVFPVGNGFQH
jgi:hypothetical protein